MMFRSGNRALPKSTPSRPWVIARWCIVAAPNRSSSPGIRCRVWSKRCTPIKECDFSTGRLMNFSRSGSYCEPFQTPLPHRNQRAVARLELGVGHAAGVFLDIAGRRVALVILIHPAIIACRTQSGSSRTDPRGSPFRRTGQPRSSWSAPCSRRCSGRTETSSCHWPFSTRSTSPVNVSGCATIRAIRPLMRSPLVWPRWSHSAFTLSRTTSFLPISPFVSHHGSGLGRLVEMDAVAREQ